MFIRYLYGAQAKHVTLPRGSAKREKLGKQYDSMRRCHGWQTISFLPD